MSQIKARRSTSVRALSLHTQIRIEELQRRVTDVLVQLGPIHARGIDAGLGIIIPPDLVALIVEDFMVNLIGKHVELRVRDIFRGKLGGVVVSPAPTMI